ncbi:hypothetical protein ONZ45_g12769 [Pleurotus djamor]|nr:hypothetical protein ONZ45_g12769 [Pleurotus djamor]
MPYSASLWDGSIEPLDVVNIHGEISTISQDGSHIAIGHTSDVSIVDFTMQPPSVIKPTDDKDPNNSGDVYSVCFSEDSQTFATGHWNGWIKLWQKEGEQWMVFRRFKGGVNEIHHLAFSRDGSRLACRAETIKVFSVVDDLVMELEDSQDSVSFVWAPSGDRLVSGTGNGNMKLWSPAQGNIQHMLNAHHGGIQCLAFRDNGQVLATGSSDRRIRIWRCDTWERTREFDIGETVSSVAFSPDGKRLVSGGRMGALHLWDVEMEDSDEAVV